MKALMHALVLVVGFGATPAWCGGTTNGQDEAYWLSNQALGEYVNLVLTRRPLAELPRLSAPTNQPVSDCDAIVVTTYARDSIWNIDQKPFKPLTDVEMVGTNFIVIKGEKFACAPARLEDVLHLLRNPMGKIPIHRIHAPLSGQEELGRTLAARLERQLNRGKKEENRPDAPPNAAPPHR